MRKDGGLMFDPVIVVGPGRCGSSSVARILHEELNVFMGFKFWPADETNPDGFYEDMEFLEADKKFIGNKIDIYSWRRLIEQAIMKRRALMRPWGFKDPRTAILLNYLMVYFREPKFIRCVRPRNEVISSLIRCYGYSRERASFLVDEKEISLNKFLPGKNVLNIYIDDLKYGTALYMINDFLNNCSLKTKGEKIYA